MAGLLGLQQKVGNRATRCFARSLVVGRVNDPAEHAADGAADMIVEQTGRGRETTGQSDVLSRSSVQRSDPLGGQPASAEVASEIDAARGHGRPIPMAIRRQAEPVLGDVSSVRVHDDERSQALSSALGARAFTVDGDIFFGRGAFRPGTVEGDHLLAHELAHAAQERGLAVRRRVDFDWSRLKPIQKGTTSTQIVTAYDKYLKIVDDPVEEQKLLRDILELKKEWVSKRKAGSLSAADKATLKVLGDLEKAINAELPELQKRVDRQPMWAELGLPQDLVSGMTDGDVQAIWAADMKFHTADVKGGNGELNKLSKPFADAVSLIGGILMRRHVGRLNPALAAVYDDPTFTLKDKNTTDAPTIKSGADRAQALAKGRMDKIRTLEQDKKANQPLTPADQKLLAEGDPNFSMRKTLEFMEAGGNRRAAALREKSTTDGTVTAEEELAIIGYSTNLYPEYNEPLRQRLSNMTAQETAMVQLAVSGLNKLKVYTNQIYRHGRNYPGYATLNRDGATVVDLGFFSAATKQQSCANAAESHEVLEVIKPKRGQRHLATVQLQRGRRSALQTRDEVQGHSCDPTEVRRPATLGSQGLSGSEWQDVPLARSGDRETGDADRRADEDPTRRLQGRGVANGTETTGTETTAHREWREAGTGDDDLRTTRRLP